MLNLLQSETGTEIDDSDLNMYGEVDMAGKDYSSSEEEQKSSEKTDSSIGSNDVQAPKIEQMQQK